MVKIHLLAIGGVLGVFALASIRSGLRLRGAANRLRDAEHVALKDVHHSDGPVRVAGTVESTGETVQPPDEDETEDGVIHRVAIQYEGEVTTDDESAGAPEDGTGAQTRTTWRHNFDHVDHVPFRVTDGGTDVRVELPEEWDGSRKQDRELVDADFGSEDWTVYDEDESFPDWLREYVADSSDLYDVETGGGISHNALNQDVRRRVARRTIRPGDEVTVVGEVVDGPEPTISGDPEMGSMLVSVQEPDDMETSWEPSSWKPKVVIGGVLLLVAAMLVLASL